MAEAKAIRAIALKPDNKRCFNCESLGTSYVVPTLGIFVCTECSGQHMNVGQRVKSISMSKFSAEEVAALEAGGNKVVARQYLANWKPEGDARKPVDKNPRKVDAWVRTVFLDKRYYSSTPGPSPSQAATPGSDADRIPLRPLSDVLGSGSGSLKLTVGGSSQGGAPPAQGPAVPPAPQTAAASEPTRQPAPTAPAAAAAAATTAPSPAAAAATPSWVDDAFGSLVGSGPAAAARPAAAAAPAAPGASHSQPQPAAFDLFAAFPPAPHPAPAPPPPSQHPAQALPPQPAAAVRGGQAGGASAGAAASAGFPAAAPVARASGFGGGGFNDDADWGAFSSAPPAHGAQPRPAAPAPAAAAPPAVAAASASVRSSRSELPSDLFSEPLAAGPASTAAAGVPASAFGQAGGYGSLAASRPHPAPGGVYGAHAPYTYGTAAPGVGVGGLGYGMGALGGAVAGMAGHGAGVYGAAQPYGHAAHPLAPPPAGSAPYMLPQQHPHGPQAQRPGAPHAAGGAGAGPGAAMVGGGVYGGAAATQRDPFAFGSMVSALSPPMAGAPASTGNPFA